MNHKPVTGLVENATSVWDEIANIHITQGNDIRTIPKQNSQFAVIGCLSVDILILTSCFADYVGQFLPWHRYYVRMHELALQNLCNYKGSHPYWDELTDLTNGNVAESPIFDPVTGFGGNGTGTNSCVPNGPFKNITLHMSNHHARGNSFCLSRGLDQSSFEEGTTSNIEECFGYQNYTDSWWVGKSYLSCTEY